MSFFSYASIYEFPPQDPSALPRDAPADRLDFLSQGAEAPFARPAPVPRMPWIDSPATGWVAGVALGPDGKGIDGAVVEMRRAGRNPFRRASRRAADGNGWFGFAGVASGAYEVRLATGARAAVEVTAGNVSRVELRSAK